MKSAMKNLLRDEKGAALILALILLLIGGLISAALLHHMGSGILAGEVHERRTAELYAADAGVEDAVWKLQQGKVGACPAQPIEPPYNINVNGRNVTVYIEYDLTSNMYKITSIAITGGVGDSGIAAIDSSTAVEAYIEAVAFDLLNGALVSMSDIDFSKDCVVTGDVYYVGEIIGKEYEHIDGEEIQVPLSAFPTQEQNEAFAQKFKDEALLGETHTGTMTIENDTTLSATYITGDLLIQKHGNDGVTVILTGPLYIEGSVDVDMMSEITGSGPSAATSLLRRKPLLRHWYMLLMVVWS
jgi:Flp pilus assembly pilin Flp